MELQAARVQRRKLLEPSHGQARPARQRRACVRFACCCTLLCALVSCAKSRSTGHHDTGDDADGGGMDAGIRGLIRDAGSRNLPDAFFIADPAPPMCGPDGGRTEPKLSDEPTDCPADKNREGCPCDTPGKSASCWPGKRVHRNHGQCKDGKTMCHETVEFGASWGPCEGYVLPDADATEGPEACRCFSSGEWTLKNLVPCIYDNQAAGQLYITSSIPDGSGYRCEANTEPTADWTTSTLKAECAGRFKLCYTLKAGNVEEPKDGDCIMRRLCLDTWYPTQDREQKLPNLPGWRATDAACMRSFVEKGGYGEMSVLGTSAECEAVDDGHGNPYVFKRTRYCSVRCGMTPDRPECKACGTGVSGQF